MFQAATYTAIETLRNGKRILIRALRPEDREAFIAAAEALTTESLRRRFFCAKSNFTESEQSFFLNPNFTGHVALIAMLEEAGQSVICGGARYIVVAPGEAELAFAVADRYQGKGIGAALMQHLATIAREAGLRELAAEVLPENTAMLKVLKNSGFSCSTKLEAGTVAITLQLT
jgi:RimJ/RimL family protein N-acetyltransferase